MGLWVEMLYNVTGHVTGNISLQDCRVVCQEAISHFVLIFRRFLRKMGNDFNQF